MKSDSYNLHTQFSAILAKRRTRSNHSLFTLQQRRPRVYRRPAKRSDEESSEPANAGQSTYFFFTGNKLFENRLPRTYSIPCRQFYRIVVGCLIAFGSHILTPFGHRLLRLRWLSSLHSVLSLRYAMRFHCLVVFFWMIVLEMVSTSTSPAASIIRKSFGTTKDGKKVEMYTLENDNGMKIRLMTRGATLVAAEVPDRDGKLADVVLGFDDVSGYESDKNQYFGCTTGRVANRISKGQFVMDGKQYKLAVNNEPNHLHGGGGPLALDRVVWTAERLNSEGQGQTITFRYHSKDGDEGYPGNLTLKVKYTLTGDNEIHINYTAETDQKTPVNLTNHTYFNLAGAGAETVLEHSLQVNADLYTPFDDTGIPTGEIARVDNTPIDFREPRRIGERLDQLIDTPLQGYDHNYVLNKTTAAELSVAAVLHEPSTGRTLTVSTTEPGVQFYTGNHLFGQEGKGGRKYPKRSACCLETQHFPDSVNQAHFPSVLLTPGQTYHQTCVYAFSVK